MATKEWETRWQVVDDVHLKRGGQATVTKVRSRADGTLGALKRLHRGNVNDVERRYRMHQEVEALKRLNGAGVPRVLEARAEGWDKTGTPLYLIMEWIDGPNLETFVMDIPRPPEEAIETVVHVADVLEQCHEVGTRHRDLKPDNIILQDGDPRAPVIVDFGQSWSRPAAQTHSFETPQEKEVGNRFLRLPEHAADSERRHDVRSDVTMLIGILFYLATARMPRYLLSEHEQPPHERTGWVSNQLKAHSRWPLLRRVFNVGFQHSIDLRFESARQLREMLAQAREVSEGATVPEPAAGLLELFESKVYQQREARRDQVRRMCAGLFDAVLRVLAKDIPGRLGTPCSGPSMSGDSARMECFICRPDYTDPRAGFRHDVRMEGGTLVASYRFEDGRIEEYYRGPIADRDGQSAALEAAAARLAAKLARVLEAKLRGALSDGQ